MKTIVLLVSFLCAVHVAMAQQDVVVKFKKLPFGRVCQESGFSQKTFLGDTNTLYVLADKDAGDEKQLDSRWVILSVDNIGKRIAPNTKAGRERLDDLQTPDKFVAVLYLAGGARTQISPPAPRLIGTKKQVVCAKDGYDLKYYVPDTTILGGGSDTIPADSMRKCIAYYEMGEGVEIEAVEIFPTEVSKYSIANTKDERVKGKLVYLTPSPSEQTGSDIQVKNGEKPKPTMPTVVFAGSPRATTKTFGKSSKTRSTECIFDLRATTKQSQKVTVKVFFVAVPNRGTQEMVFDVKEQELVCAPNRITNVSLRSDEVSEYRSFYANDSRVVGITLKGAIIQVYCDDKMLTWAPPVASLQKVKDEPDVVRKMGLLKSSLYD